MEKIGFRKIGWSLTGTHPVDGRTVQDKVCRCPDVYSPAVKKNDFLGTKSTAALIFLVPEQQQQHGQKRDRQTMG
jgi:hypothetical protein